MKREKNIQDKKFKNAKKWCSNLNPRLTLDTEEDYIFLKKIYKGLKNVKDFTLVDILKFLKIIRIILK